MKKSLLIIGFIIVSNQLFSQTNWERFWKQSQPMKIWVVFHPFKAEKALKITELVNKTTDSIFKTEILGTHKSGGQIDAFRHAYWMAKLQQEIGKSAALALGKAHEKDNYKTFKKRHFEDGKSPDKASKEMDLLNNKIGLTFSIKNDKRSNIGLIYKIINAIKKGDLKILKIDNNGNFLTCDNKLITVQELNKWDNKKCIVASNNKH